MFRSKTKVPILTKKLIVELALRSGSPTSESPSPYKGLLSLTFQRMEAIKSYGIEFEGSLYELLNTQEDFNADLKCPTFEEYTGTEYQEETKPRMYLPSSGIPADYARRLEDIDSSWVISYVDNILYAIINNSTHSIKEYGKNHQLVRMMSDEEDDSVVSETELVLAHSNDFSPEEIAKAKEKIPYLLRRLHDKSKQLRIHVISLLIAYEKAKRYVDIQNRRSRRRKIQVAPRHLLMFGVYKMNPDGSIGPVLGDDANNREESFKLAKAWLFQYEGYQDEYNQDAINLLHYYDVMGIDITKEDPSVYQENYISQLTVLYITSNREYVMRKRTGFHREVFEALKRLPLESFENETIVEEVDDYAIVDNTMHIYNDSVFIDTSYRDSLDDAGNGESYELNKNITMLIAYYNIIFSTLIDTTKMITQDGFLFSDLETPFMLDISAILGDEEDDTFVGSESLALLHETGYLVRLSKTHFTKIVRVEDVLETLMQYHAKKAYGQVATIPANAWTEVSV